LLDKRLRLVANCALYLPTEKVPLKNVFPKGRSDGNFLRAATWFEFDSPDGPIRLNLHHDDLAQHLRGFLAYVAQQPNSATAIAEAGRLIRSMKACLGVRLPRPVSAESPAFQSLFDILRRFGGFMFVADSVLLPSGKFLVGPMAVEEPVAPNVEESQKYLVNPERCRHEGPTDGIDPKRVAMRERNYRLLAEHGFQSSQWLPLYRTDDHEDQLRPFSESAARLFALNALFLWVAAPEDVASSDRLRSFFRINSLEGHLTRDEFTIFSKARPESHDAHAGTIGWRLENMWALAWVLGFEPAPAFFQGQIPQEIIDRMLFEFLPPLDETLDAFLASVKPRTSMAVTELEDLFYCAHNAVRSAQSGEATVPAEFHPVRDGGAVHERRHSLTWTLSPGTSWDDTDLST
jgi:uncharacterized protein DUF4272